MSLMGRRRKSVNPSEPFGEVSHERYSGEQLLALHFIHHPLTWFTREDCGEHLKSMGRKLHKGTLYNILSTLLQREMIESDGGMPARYRLLQQKNQSNPIGVQRRGRFGPLVVKVDLYGYLGTLRFEDVSRVHDIKLWTPVRDLDFVNESWTYSNRQRVYWRKELVDGKYRFSIRAYEKALTLEISVACTRNPVAVGIAGLNRFYSVLCSVRARFMNSASVPHAGDWIVKQWHFGKDAKNTIAGMTFEVTWHDLHGNLVRVYSDELKVRVERIESPNEFVAKLLDSAKGVKKKLTEGITCVASMNPKIEKVYSVKTCVEVLCPPLMLHV